MEKTNTFGKLVVAGAALLFIGVLALQGFIVRGGAKKKRTA